MREPDEIIYQQHNITIEPRPSKPVIETLDKFLDDLDFFTCNKTILLAYTGILLHYHIHSDDPKEPNLNVDYEFNDYEGNTIYIKYDELGVQYNVHASTSDCTGMRIYIDKKYVPQYDYIIRMEITKRYTPHVLKFETDLNYEEDGLSIKRIQ